MGDLLYIDLCADSTQLMMIQLMIFQLYDGAKAICIQEKLPFEFSTLIFSRASECSTVLCLSAGQRQLLGPGILAQQNWDRTPSVFTFKFV